MPINYLLLGYLQSRSVGLIRYYDKTIGKDAVATGFLISEHLLLTNYHVFPVGNETQFKARFQGATVEFNYEFDLDRNRAESIRFDLQPGRFFHSYSPLDMAVVAVSPSDRSNRKLLKDQGYLVLGKSVGTVRNGDFASIIQHPSGKEKQIAIRKNEVTGISDTFSINYVSDTAQGSSGAPVFNDQWQVIALHSAGVAKKNEAGQYVDDDNQVIEPVNGYIDEERVVWLSNRGFRAGAILEHLESNRAVDPLIQPLLSSTYSDSRPFARLSRPVLEMERATDVPLGPAPVAAASPSLMPLDIRISISTSGQVTAATAKIPAATDFALESKYEDELDLSDCEGFDEYFLDEYIPMPVPSPALKRQLAPLLGSPNAYTLKYHHFSTLHHAVRRVPIVSAINVHGKYRYPELDEEGSRKDRWYRDNRIDFDVQLDNQFYKKSGFDRGHLARREDAEWGTTVAKAKLAADLTCSFANAVPQVPALNRAKYGYKGRWGLLETELLEKGPERETGKSARICVFNGPLFDESDPIFKGVPVALSFYKVVVWYDGTRELRTTCYRLSQEKLVGEIEFEVLKFDDIFKTSQVPISLIEKTTGLKFHDSIVRNDTSGGDELPVG
ncbi:MAG: DNA/RNA non-specific endonuclease [Planctomycetaceae bacterium]|nr:DNA/RNA non-specific endonuclease [Planctomycetaceae bacterium]